MHYRVDYNRYSHVDRKWHAESRTLREEDSARDFIKTLLDSPDFNSIGLYRVEQIHLGKVINDD